MKHTKQKPAAGAGGGEALTNGLKRRTFDIFYNTTNSSNDQVEIPLVGVLS